MTLPLLGLSLGRGDLGVAVIYVILLILSVAVHEFGHAWVADRLGDPLPRSQGRVTLNPTRHADLLGTIIFPLLTFPGVLGWGKPVEWTGNPRYLTRRFSLRTIKLLVSIAGPAMNLLTALVVSGVYLIVKYFFPSMEGFAEQILLRGLITMNLGLMFFNLLPIPPLDGRSFLYFLPESLAVLRETLMKYGPYIFLVLLVTGAPLGVIMSPFYRAISMYIGLLHRIAAMF
jgi:Zn-dependent protease